MFGFDLGDVKIFLVICVLLVFSLLFFLPPNDWWFFWNYIEDTPVWIVLAQAWPFWLLGFGITIFYILIREVVVR